MRVSRFDERRAELDARPDQPDIERFELLAALAEVQGFFQAFGFKFQLTVADPERRRRTGEHVKTRRAAAGRPTAGMAAARVCGG